MQPRAGLHFHIKLFIQTKFEHIITFYYSLLLNDAMYAILKIHDNTIILLFYQLNAWYLIVKGGILMKNGCIRFLSALSTPAMLVISVPMQGVLPTAAEDAPAIAEPFSTTGGMTVTGTNSLGEMLLAKSEQAEQISSGWSITDVTVEDALVTARCYCDVVLLQKWLLAVPNTRLNNWKAADLCKDDKLDVFDLCLMKRELLQK